MIYNLNSTTFYDFGIILHDKFTEACDKFNVKELLHHTISDKHKDFNTLLRYKNSTTLLDITSINGVALLVVSSDSTLSDMKVFLFDKPVIIKEGTYFQVVPFYGMCTFNTALTSLEYSIEKISINKDLFPLDIFPKIDISKIHTLFYQQKEKGFSFKGEKHNFWEITYVDKGVLHTSVDKHEFILNTDDLIFYNKNQFHTQWTDINTSSSFITITFDMNLKDNLALSNKIFAIDKELKEILFKILHEYNIKNYYSNDLIICYLKEFIIKLFRYEQFKDTINSLNNNFQNNIENSIVNQSIEFIKTNIHRKLSIPEIAHTIPISPSYLSTIFKKHTNYTIVDYINNYRLEKSKELLTKSSHTITEISSVLGYTSVHYFSRQFKKTYGVSPSKFSHKNKT